MSDEFEKHAATIANSSGFPLQIRVANIGESTKKWRVFLQEHPWKSDVTGPEGFLDLVFFKPSVHNRDVMVIECKRVKQTKWVFLIPKPKPLLFSRARLLESRRTDLKWDRFDWHEMQTEPRLYESQFCAIPGQEHGHRNLLERTSAELIQATEALAWQEKELFEGNRTKIQKGPSLLGYEFYRIYIPVIVTTAELIISYFDPESISLKDGFLPSDSVFEAVSAVRFRKSLTTKFGSLPGKDIQEMHDITERTIFIVNAEGFHNFLLEWGFIDIC